MSTLNDQIKRLEILQGNALAILSAFNDANFSDAAFAEINFLNEDGSNTVYNIPSNINIDRKLKSLQNTIDELTSLTDSGQTLATSIADPSTRTLFISSFERSFRSILSSEFIVSSTLSIKSNPIFEALADPLCRVQIALPSKYAHIQAARVLKYVLTASDKSDKFETLRGTLAANSTRGVVLQSLNDQNATYKIFDDVVTLDAKKVRYYGSFSVFEMNLKENGDLICTIDKNTYTDSESAVLNSKEITIGDFLVTSDGDSIWEIVEIALINKISITLRKRGGYRAISTGIETLLFHDQNDIKKEVSISIEGGERSFVFFAPISTDTGIAGEWSSMVAVSSADYSVESGGIAVPFDEYYNTNVLAVGNWLLSQVSDQAVSRSVALDIDKPELDPTNFDVVQINSHLSRTGDFEKIKRLSEEKNNLSSKITSLSNEIFEIRNRISRTVYRSSTQQKQDEITLKAKVNSKNLISAQLRTTIKEISTVSSTTSANNVSPKYKVRGFFEIVEPVSSDGGVQRIVSYDVRHKYVPSNSSASISQTLSKIGGIDGTKSPWIDVAPITLEKEYNSDTDKYEWEQNNIADAQKNNINQIDIPIVYGEAVIIQVRAVSEAGYPSNPAKSEWSDEMRIEFPTSLAQEETIGSIVSQNAEDEQVVKLDEFLDSRGYNLLTAESYEASDQYFTTKAFTIDSGFKRDGVVQNLFVFLKELSDKVASLEETVLRQTVSWSIYIEDSRGKVYPITDRSSIELFAGYYSESVDVNDSSNYGDYLEETFYLVITNNSSSSGDILTLSAGDITARTTDSNYTNAPFQTFNNPLSNQKNGQIIYLREGSLSGAESFYVSDVTSSSNEVTPSDVDSGVVSTLKNVVSWDGSSATLVKLLDGANSTGYVSMLKSHPLYLQYQNNPTSGNLSLLSAEFSRVSNYTKILRDGKAQRDYDSLSSPIPQYQVPQYQIDDKYLVGAESCGSMLFVRPQNQSSIQVETADASSPFLIEGGKSKKIPIIFQYRMTDALGRLNGDGSKNLAASTLRYTKKIGFDIFAGSKIQFDLEVFADFKPTLQSGRSSLNSTPIVSSSNDSVQIL